MAKVRRKGDVTSSIAGVKLERGTTPRGPNFQELREGSRHTCQVGHPGIRHSETGWRGCDAPPFKKCNINSQSLVLDQMAHATICRNIRVDYHLDFGRFGSTAVPKYSVSETKSEAVQILKAIFPYQE